MNQSKLPGIISAVVVLIVLGLLGVMLYNRDQQAAGVANEPGTSAAPDGEATMLAMAEATALAMVSETTTPASGQAPEPEAMGEGAAAELPPVERENMYSQMPPMTIDPEQEYQATITTPRGDIVVRLRPDIAPQTVNSFVFLARQGFYDGLTWHRVLPNFMAQGGDPTGTGTGGPGYNVPAEFSRAILFDRPGLLAMARANDPDSAGSQFFITTAPAPHLSGQYTIFGEVIEGQEIVDNIPLRDPATATTPGEEIVSITIDESES